MSPAALALLNLISGLVLAAAQTAPLFMTNPDDKAKAEKALALARVGVPNLMAAIQQIVEGTANPDSIDISSLFDKDAEAILAELRGGVPTPIVESTVGLVLDSSVSPAPVVAEPAPAPVEPAPGA